MSLVYFMADVHDKEISSYNSQKLFMPTVPDELKKIHQHEKFSGRTLQTFQDDRSC